MLYHGYSFGLKNHAIQIPILKSYFHPELYQNDPMVATRSHFITFNYLFLAAIEKVFGHKELLFFNCALVDENTVFHGYLPTFANSI